MVIASMNVNSLLPHLDEIELLLKDNGIHFLSLNETKIDDTLSDNLFKIEGYIFRRLDRNRHGGGIAFFVEILLNAILEKIFPSQIWKS